MILIKWIIFVVQNITRVLEMQYDFALILKIKETVADIYQWDFGKFKSKLSNKHILR